METQQSIMGKTPSSTGTPASAPKTTERRGSRRCKITQLMRIRPSDPEKDHFEDMRGTLSVSRSGVFFQTSEAGYEIGMRLFVTLPFSQAPMSLNREYLAGEHGAALKREIPIGRFGAERDLDGPLLLLVSDAGRFVTGATIVADGGQMVALRGIASKMVQKPESRRLLEQARNLVVAELALAKNCDVERVQRELDTLALDDLRSDNSILLIEWGEKFPRLVRERDVEISLEQDGENKRRIKIVS